MQGHLKEYQLLPPARTADQTLKQQLHDFEDRLFDQELQDFYMLYMEYLLMFPKNQKILRKIRGEEIRKR